MFDADQFLGYVYRKHKSAVRGKQAPPCTHTWEEMRSMTFEGNKSAVVHLLILQSTEDGLKLVFFLYFANKS